MRDERTKIVTADLSLNKIVRIKTFLALKFEEKKLMGSLELST